MNKKAFVMALGAVVAVSGLALVGGGTLFQSAIYGTSAGETTDGGSWVGVAQSSVSEVSLQGDSFASVAPVTTSDTTPEITGVVSNPEVDVFVTLTGSEGIVLDQVPAFTSTWEDGVTTWEIDVAMDLTPGVYTVSAEILDPETSSSAGPAAEGTLTILPSSASSDTSDTSVVTSSDNRTSETSSTSVIESSTGASDITTSSTSSETASFSS